MEKLDYEQLKKIMLDCFDQVGHRQWLNKEGVVFRLKADYGDMFDKQEAYKIYDEIYGKYMEDNCG